MVITGVIPENLVALFSQHVQSLRGKDFQVGIALLRLHGSLIAYRNKTGNDYRLPGSANNLCVIDYLEEDMVCFMGDTTEPAPTAEGAA